ncbi:hypothetical protein SKAU_G00319250 [Synaphobranchus kaupii]|uniref:Uncharacterized protein n=1 Tax=Synaphobranchus kaupii TaxID=118154 RepID=A0A9Q1END8_SYNKA|nr:hypothetical protein SKAU_G00319250 [Synaphobranchus kaupii]
MVTWAVWNFPIMPFTGPPKLCSMFHCYPAELPHSKREGWCLWEELAEQRILSSAPLDGKHAVSAEQCNVQRFLCLIQRS